MQPHTTIIATREGRNYVCFTNDTVRRRRLELLGDVYPGNEGQGEATAGESLLPEHITDVTDNEDDEEPGNQESGELFLMPKNVPYDHLRAEINWEESITAAVQSEPDTGEPSNLGVCCPVCEEWVTDASSIKYARPKIDDDETTSDEKLVKYGPPTTEVMGNITHDQREKASIDPNGRLISARGWYGKEDLTSCEDIIGPGLASITTASSSCGYDDHPRTVRIITDSTGMSMAVTLLNIQRMKDQTPSYKAWEERQH